LVVWYEIVIKVEWQIAFWDLVLHHHGVWNLLNDGTGHLLEELLILGFIVSCVPVMLFAVLARLYNENNV
jgi:hypothetical protein